MVYGFPRSFKDIIKQFKTNGAMQNSLILMLTVDSVSQLREAQPEDHTLRKGEYTDEIALTLAAIKILDQYFTGNRKLWILVEKKARRFVMTSSGATKEIIDKALEDLVTCYDPIRS